MTDEQYIQSLLGIDLRQSEVDTILEIVERLKAENAILRERLERAGGVPCKVGDKLYFVNEYLETPKIQEHTVTAIIILVCCIKVYVEDGGYFLIDCANVCFDREAAEARLKELQRKE